MNRILKRSALLAGMALTLCQLQPSALAAAADNIFPDPVVASGKGFEIKNSQLNDAFIAYNTGVVANGGSIPESERDLARSNLLQHLIITKLLMQRATPDEKSKIQKSVDENIDRARQSTPNFDSEIKASGMTLDQVRTRGYEEQLCKRVLQRETTNGIYISDEDAKKFFNDNPDKFEVPEQVRVSHILVSTLDPLTQHPLPADQKKLKEQSARDIKARAEKGEDFGKLVKQYSDDPGSKNTGGEYTFPRGRMVPEFEAASFALKPGQISDIVETQYGYHVIKLLEKLPAKHEQLAEVEPKIKDYLRDKKAEATLPAYLDKLKADAGVTIMDPATGKPVSSSTK